VNAIDIFCFKKKYFVAINTIGQRRAMAVRVLLTLTNTNNFLFFNVHIAEMNLSRLI